MAATLARSESTPVKRSDQGSARLRGRHRGLRALPLVQVRKPGGRPTIATADNRASLAIGGLMQFDMGGYFQNPNPQFPQLNDGVNLRRGRIYFVGKFDDFKVNITPDFGGSPDGAPTLNEANINYTGVKPVTATVGYFDPFVSFEDATSSSNLLFVERPSIINIERSVAASDQRASLGAKGATEDYFASAYLTGPDFGDQDGALLNGEQVGFVGRLAERPYHDEDWNCMPGCRVRPCSTPTSMQWHTWSKRHHNLSRRPTGAAHRLQQAGLHRHAFRERSECLRRRARYRLA